MNALLRVFLGTTASLLLAGAVGVQAQTTPGENPPVGIEPTKTEAVPDTSLYAADSAGHLYAEIETNKGTIEAELDFKRAPLTAMNFVGLAEGTLPFQSRPAAKPFYDGQTFHRVVADFVIQGGDPDSSDPAFPLDKLGDGGPGYTFPDEFSPGLRHDGAGVLSMANDGPDTNGSQFFITLAPVNRLNYLHSVFGQVVRGLEVVKQITQGDKIIHVTILRSGPEAEAFRASTDKFEKLKAAVIAKRKASSPANLAYLIDETKSLPEFRVKNFNFKLANYERTTGHRIAVRLLTQFNPEPAEQTMGNAVKKLSAAAGISDQDSGVLAAYFDEQKTWLLRLGEATYPALLGVGGSTEELMAKGILHDQKAALTASASALTGQGKLKEGVDSLIDTLILKLDDDFLRHKPVEDR